MKTKTFYPITCLGLGILLCAQVVVAQSAKPAKKGKPEQATRVICIVNSDTVITEGDASSYRWESKSGGGNQEKVVIITTDGDLPPDVAIMQMDMDDQAVQPGKGEKMIVTKHVVAEGQPNGKARVHTIKVMNGDTVTNEISEERIEGFQLDGEVPGEVIIHRIGKAEGDQAVTVDVKDLGNGVQVVRVYARTLRIEAIDGEEASKLGMGESKGLQLKDLSYSPNPNQGRFTLSFRIKEQGAVGVRIHSLDGRELYREDLPAGSKQYSRDIDLGDVPAGVYLLEVQQGSQKAVRRIVVE
jgi:hypothetical protein